MPAQNVSEEFHLYLVRELFSIMMALNNIILFCDLFFFAVD